MGTRKIREHGRDCLSELFGLRLRDPRRFECLPCGERMGLYATRRHRCKDIK